MNFAYFYLEKGMQTFVLLSQLCFHFDMLMPVHNST
jgi:hypothetical protein